MPLPEEKPDEREKMLALIEFDQNQLTFIVDRVRNPGEPSARLRASRQRHAAK